MRSIIRQAFLMPVLFIAIQSCNTKTNDILGEANSPSELKKDLGILRGLLQDAHGGAFIFINSARLDKLFDSISGTIKDPLTKREFLDKVDFIIENIHCAHTDSYFPEKYLDTLTKTKCFFPLPVIKIDNELLLNTDAFDIPFGSEIFLVNNHPVKELFQKLLYHKHTDGFAANNKDAAINRDFSFDYFIAFGPAKEFTIRYRDEETNDIVTKTIAAETLDNILRTKQADEYYNFPNDIPYDFTIFEEKRTGLMTITNFDESSYSQRRAFFNFLENSFTLIKLKNLHNLIIDYRNNSGGYFKCSYALLSYFIDSPVMHFDSVIRRFNLLPFKDYVSKNDSSTEIQIDSSYGDYHATAGRHYTIDPHNIDTCFPAQNIYRGKTYIIIDGNVISAAASSAALLKEMAAAVIIGEESGGGYAAFNSDILSYTLPNSGIRIDIPTVRYYPPVIKKTNINPITPDHYIPLNKKDFMSLEDGAMSFILDSLIR